MICRVGVEEIELYYMVCMVGREAEWVLPHGVENFGWTGVGFYMFCKAVERVESVSPHGLQGFHA